MTLISKMFRKVFRKKKAAIVSVCLVLVAAVTAVAYSLNPFISQEQELGTITGNAASINDTSASGGKTVKFGTQQISSYPTTPPAQICGNSAILGNGPTSAPTGAITVPAGDNSSLVPNFVVNGFSTANKTFWFAPGTHTLGSGTFAQIGPGNNSTFIGAPGAIIDGQSANRYAFSGTSTGVTIKYLTIQNFVSPNDEGTVNHDSGSGWTMQYNTITNNGGAGVFAASNNTVSYNCLQNNSQYGFQVYSSAGPNNVTLDHNEISGNNTGNWEVVTPGCGCTGGGKFWDAANVTVTNNYVHDNKSVGLWADTNDNGFKVEGNYISNNDAEGFFYEISYNASVKYNNFIRNGIVKGPTNPGFPTPAIYLSESGGDSRVANTFGYSQIEVSNNKFTDNWGGVVAWENADRFCNSPANTSTGYCTLVNPSVTLSTCSSGTINNPPNYNDCRWKTQNVKVHDNLFQLTQSSVGNGCAFNTSCGYNGTISNFGTTPSWSPYMGNVVQTAITFNQGNVFSTNTYQGSWQFMAKDTGTRMNLATWQASPYNQDSGSQ